MTVLDGHRYFLDIDRDGIRLRVECPWAAHPTLTTRVCWPTDLDGTPETPPQPICTYAQWAEAVDASEILSGSLTVEVGCTPAWDHDTLELTIVRVANAYCTTLLEQMELARLSPRQRTETIEASILNAAVPK